MDEICDRNDNEHNRIHLQNHIDGIETTKTVITTESLTDSLPSCNNNNDIGMLSRNLVGSCAGAPPEDQANDSASQMDATKETLPKDTGNERDERPDNCNCDARSIDSDSTDDQSDNNSTDNLSFNSDDPNNGLINDVILLPNNLISEEEDVSSNSDDCVYAYRGAEDFDAGVRAGEEDENDFLEMDFEPDPPSEVENESNLLVPAEAVVNLVTAFEHPPIAAVILSEAVERSIEHGPTIDWTQSNGHLAKDDTLAGLPESAISPSNICSKLAVDVDKMMKKIEDDANRVSPPSSRGEYYNNTVSLSMQKYTGTIPKTIRSVALRPVRTKSNSSVPNGTCSECSQFSVESECKRCRTAKYRLHSNEQQPNEAATSNTLPTSCSNGIGKTSTSANGSSSYNGDLARLRIECLLDEAAVSSSADAVAIFSVHCTENDIVEALNKLGIQPNREILHQHLQPEKRCKPDAPSTSTMKVDGMNIPEYLEHVSKRNCNYITLMEAIQAACDLIDFDIEFIPMSSDVFYPEMIQVPVAEILQRLSSNGSLRNILGIQNKRFHKMNVLGKIVNVIRKFSDMRHDINQENYIAIPQYYRSGYIHINRKPLCAPRK